MKFKLMQLAAVTALSILAFSCKGEKKNETTAKEAEEVKEAPAVAVTYTVDPTASTIEWTGSKPTGKHMGTIALSNGTLKVQENKVLGGSFAIDMTTITVTDLEGDEKAGLEAHLKGEGEGKEDHFFNVAKFKDGAFEITAVNEKDGKTVIEGNLTLKGIKKNISFPATISSNDSETTITSDVFTINRTEWGVNYGSKSVFENLGDKFINDDIEIKVSLKAKKA
ncbi:YceI family protein [Aquimarina sp. TRL1]|uniref:YceI family protein n=1 Tax=Aquimarina sp. (strain TRL1) TaxID=2736252 RepID=UPI001589D07E|nr:YceI family protein [Aquimarina sp. TRL1]QKX05887.1 YceI family protein [Aquimarina sp. TRL1]